jgi:ribonuclease E
MSREAPPSVDEDRLRAAYELLRGVVAEKAARSGSVRDSEVKRQMVEKDPDFDEAALGFRKFSRFLRQAHDEEVITLERTGEGNYKISAVAGSVPAAQEAPAAKAEAKESTEEKGRSRGRRDRSGSRRGRGSRGSSGDAAETPPSSDAGDAQTSEDSGAETAVEPVPEPVAEPVADAPIAEAPAAEPVAEKGATEAAPTRLTGRRRAPKPKAGPKVVPGPVGADEAPAKDIVAEEKKDAAPARPTTRTMGRFRRGSVGSGAPVTGAAASGGSSGTRSVEAGEATAEKGAKKPATGASKEMTSGQEDMVERMARGYQGVGRRTAERLVEEFGDRVLDVIDNEPGRIEGVLPKGRAQAVIDGRRAEREGSDG